MAIIPNMISQAELVELVTDAYNHLYDLVYLRTHPLGPLLFAELNLTSKERSLRLHHLLLDVINDLNPGNNAPVSSQEWRRYRLMDLRFNQGLDTQAVADLLFISRRHLYREQLLCMVACAEIIKSRLPPATISETTNLSPNQPSEERWELLRFETSHPAQEHHRVNVNEVIQQTYSLISGLVQQKGLRFTFDFAQNLPNVNIERTILRQVLMGIFNSIFIDQQDGEVLVSSNLETDTILLLINTQSKEEILAHESLKILGELAMANEFHFSSQVDSEGYITFSVRLPSIPRQTIILADDNDDMRRLIHNYLNLLYHIVETNSGAEVIRLVNENQPIAVILDLMMPDMDGWEVLQSLLKNEKTARIPVIICSVLGIKELALSLGASAFLPKPFTEAELLQTLRSLEL